MGVETSQVASEANVQQAIDDVYRFAATQMAAGKRDEEVESMLVQQGLTVPIAREVVEQLRVARIEAKKKAGRKHMVVGGLWFAGGSIVTALTYSAAASSAGGGRYMVFWGAIVFGAIEFVWGLIQYTKASV